MVSTITLVSTRRLKSDSLTHTLGRSTSCYGASIVAADCPGSGSSRLCILSWGAADGGTEVVDEVRLVEIAQCLRQAGHVDSRIMRQLVAASSRR